VTEPLIPTDELAVEVELEEEEPFVDHEPAGPTAAYGRGTREPISMETRLKRVAGRHGERLESDE
jgi:hypothetical protein